MTETQRKNINVIIPLAVAGYVSYSQFQKNKDYKKTAIIGLVIFIVIWAITASITSGIKRKKDTELITNVPPDPNYNPAPIAQALYQDINEVFGFRNKQIYKDLAALTDAQFVAVAKYWNDNYYSKGNQTLKQAINDEVLGWELESTLQAINQRFVNLKIN